MSSPWARYAVYWAPEEDHPLWEAGCRWLGRDARFSTVGTPPPCRGAPWRYGFHATLKAPMPLREGAKVDDFSRAVAGLAAQVRRFELPALHVATLDDFIALRPSREARDGDPLYDLAARCVQELDPWRSPKAESLGATSLDPEQRALLIRWGYPHVLGRWRFHLTLSDALDPSSTATDGLKRAAIEHFAPSLAQPLRFESLCVFEEPHRGAPLKLMMRSALA